MRKVYIAADLPAATLMQQQLQQQGIACRLFNEHALGAAGELPLVEVYPEVWVDEDRDYDRARQLVKACEAHWQRPMAQRQCPACDEWNPASFEICWQCQQDLS